MTTINKYLIKLPPPYNKMALNNSSKHNNEGIKVASLSLAVLFAFNWTNTEEGSDFWEAIYEDCLHIEKTNK